MKQDADAARSRDSDDRIGWRGVIQVLTALAAVLGVIATVVVTKITTDSTRAAQTESA